MNKKEILANGMGRYIDDIKLPGMLYMNIYRSPYAHAKIKNIKGGLNSSEFKSYYKSSVGEMAELSGNKEDKTKFLEPSLAIDEVKYYGQPIAAVFSENRYESEDLLNSINVDFEPMESTCSIDAALGKKDISKYTMAKYELGKKFDEKAVDHDIVLEDTFFNERVIGNSIETRGCIADYKDGMLTFYVSTQSVHSVKGGLMNTLNLDKDHVRVIQADTGGAFGSKGGFYPEYLIAAYASMKYKKPVKWIETRSEYLSAAYAGRGVKSYAKIYAKNNGKITGLEAKIYVDAGAYDAGAGGFSSYFIGFQVTGPYRIENVYIESSSIITNKSPVGPYRGAGRPEASFIMERMMDLLADKLNKDPADLRLLNASDEPFTSPTGEKIEEPTRPFFKKALDEFDYYNVSKNNKTGISFFVLIPASRPGDSARIQVKNGRVNVFLGGDTHGQGHEFFARNIINEMLGVDRELVTLENGDTSLLDMGVGAWGSRSAIAGGSALAVVCEKIRDQVIQKYGVYNTDNLLNGEYDASEFYKIDFDVYSLNANMVTSYVKDGKAMIKDWHSYYDLGKVLDKSNVIGQIEGGALQGIGQVLSESLRYSDDGQLIISSIEEAGLLNAENIPENFHIKWSEGSSKVPSHAKGLGESPTIGTPSALVRSIELSTNKRIRETPIKPDYFY